MTMLGLGAILVGCSNPSSQAPVEEEKLGYTLVEQVEKQSNVASIAYSKYVLDNGLTVILSPDDSDPLVHVDVTYHVGSAREEVGKSGFAHFFEHMMFQGSKHVGDQEHFKIITEAGGDLNGTTNRDRTNYYQTVPSNQLEKVLWMESDRMGFLLEAVSQRKFEIQRDTVKNERAQNYDNRPYGLTWEKLGEAMYPEGHPYSWQTIGYVEDLDRVDVNDLKAFFLRWYGPNNAVLTIGGDIDEQQTMEWISQYFGSIPEGPAVESAPKQPAVLPEDRFVTLEDRIRQPMMVMGWPTSYRGADDQRSLEALATIVGNGRNSILYQELVKTQKALSAAAYSDCSELACNFYVVVMVNSGDEANLGPIYDQVSDIMENFTLEQVEQSQLDQIAGSAKASSIFSLQSVSGKVSMLASNETFYGQPDRLQSNLEAINAVDQASVYQSYLTYVKDKPRVTLSVVPKGESQLAARPANFVTPERTLPEYQKVSEDQLDLRTAVDNFDRSVMPQVGTAVSVTLPKLYQFHTDNDVEVLGTVSSETPTVLFQLRMPAGNRYAAIGKEGIAGLTASMMSEGTQLRDSEEIQAQLDGLGSSVSIRSGEYTTSITVSSLSEHFEETLDVVEEALFKPAFNESDFARIKQQALEGLVYEHQTPSWLASQATRQVAFGDSFYARSSDGTSDSVASLTLDDVKQFYAQHYSPHGAQVLVVGDISERELKKQLQRFERWEGETAPILRRKTIDAPTGQSIYVVDKPRAPQTIVRLVRNGMPFDATGELYLSQLANFNLAGNFNSRINQNLREDKGYTYGASGYFASNREVGIVVFNAQVRADSTVDSIKEILLELEQYSSQGMTDAELNFMRMAVGQQDALKYETPGQKAQLLSSILTYSLDYDYLNTRNRIAATVDKQTLDEMAAKWFNPDDYQIVVVGDAESLIPQLKALNIPLQQLEIAP
nr:pitrilysin family protein [Vibrio ulleungensis]